MYSKIILFFAATTCLSIHAAEATDWDQTSSDWSSFYLGINSGYAWGNAHGKISLSAPFAPGYFTAADIPLVQKNGNIHLHPKGYVGGGQIGYNKCFHTGFAIGLETDFNALLFNKSKSVSAIYPEAGTGGYTIYQKVSTDWLYTLRPRVGYAYKKMFTFLTGGLTLTNLKYKQIFSDNTFSAQGASSSLDAHTTVSKNKTSVGWAVGAGMEYIVYERLSVCLSYLYTRFNSLSCSDKVMANYQNILYASTLHNSADLSANIARVGLNWRL